MAVVCSGFRCKFWQIRLSNVDSYNLQVFWRGILVCNYWRALYRPRDNAMLLSRETEIEVERCPSDVAVRSINFRDNELLIMRWIHGRTEVTFQGGTWICANLMQYFKFMGVQLAKRNGLLEIVPFQNECFSVDRKCSFVAIIYNDGGDILIVVWRFDSARRAIPCIGFKFVCSIIR